MNSWSKGGALAALVVAVGAVGVWLGRESVSANDAPATQPTAVEETSSATATVQTQSLRKGTLTQSVEAYGSIQAIAGSLLNISVPFEAKVAHVFVAPGQSVDASTPVAEVGPTPDAQLQFRQAQDALSAAESNFASVKKRRDEQLATNADVATAEQAMKTAQTQVENLRQRGVGEAKQLLAGVEGFVGQVNVQSGQVAPAGTALVTIEPAHELEASVGVDPIIADALKPGGAAELSDVHATEDAHAVHGTVRSIAQQLNPQTRLRDVSIKLPQDSKILQGTFVVARIPTRTASGWVVPRSAVLPDDEDQVVFTVVDGKAKRRVVEIALSTREQLLIVSDELQDGDQIVTVGNAELEDGMAVKVAAPADVKDEDDKPGGDSGAEGGK